MDERASSDELNDEIALHIGRLTIQNYGLTLNLRKITLEHRTTTKLLEEVTKSRDLLTIELRKLKMPSTDE